MFDHKALHFLCAFEREIPECVSGDHMVDWRE